MTNDTITASLVSKMTDVKPNSSQPAVSNMADELALKALDIGLAKPIDPSTNDPLRLSTSMLPAPSTMAPLWNVGKPAPFDGTTADIVRVMSLQTLAELGYYEPKVAIRVEPDRETKKAVLTIDIADEGIRGTVDDIEISGARTNTIGQIQDFLKIRNGMQFRASLLSDITNSLWNSARFLRHTAALKPLPDPGKFRLEIKLKELDGAPPLNQDFNPNQKALLKFADWLGHFEEHHEDILMRFDMAREQVSKSIEIVFAPDSGIVFLLRNTTTNGIPSIERCAVLTHRFEAVYSPARKSKYLANIENNVEIPLLFRVDPNNNPQPHSDKMWLGVGMSFHYKEDAGFKNNLPVQIVIAPVAATYEFLKCSSIIPTNGNTLVFDLGEADAPHCSEWLAIDSDSGRLIAYDTVLKTNGLQLRFSARPGEGLFAGTLREIHRLTADYTNTHNPQRPYAALLTHAGLDILESSNLLSEVLGQLSDALLSNEKDKSQQRHALELVQKGLSAIVPTVIRHSAGISEALSEMRDIAARVMPAPGDTEREIFIIPMSMEKMQMTQQNILAMVVPFLLAGADELWKKNAWPWILAREWCFNLVGAGKYSGYEIQKMGKSDIGPVASLFVAHLFGKLNPTLSRAFAQKGLSRLTYESARKDFDGLLDSQGVIGKLAKAGFKVFKNVDEKEIDWLAGITALPSADVVLLKDLANSIHDPGNDAVSDAIWRVIGRHWESSVWSKLDKALNRFTPKVDAMNDPSALFGLGLTLLSGAGPIQDAEEAASAFQKAARLGHSGAQLQIGKCYYNGIGVTQNLEEAAQWFRQAADQKEPHAACSLGFLYLAGRGVAQTLESAELWFMRDDTNQCPVALTGLANICEMRHDMGQAIVWLRKAAAAGYLEAEYKLGEWLSDGISAKIDYEESYIWFSIAADRGHLLAQSDLRRIKRKLNPDQLEAAKRRAEAIQEHLESMQINN
jgi:TPR repeat protein